MILVISHARDEHARSVLERLAERGAEAALVDLADFPTAMSLSLLYDGADSEYELRLADGRRLALADVRSVWWRRPQAFRLHSDLTESSHREFAWTECLEAVSGLWRAVEARWMNPPTQDQDAARKAYQLHVARRLGLRIPETLISNDPDRARDFVARHGIGRTIYKAFSATESQWRETRVVRDGEDELLDSVRYAPVIFQEYVEAEVDLRVTVVGDEVFPAAVYSQDSGYKVDYRMDMGRSRIEPTTLPTPVRDELLALMRTLGIAYGAIDLRRTPQGEHVFLEVNPAGQWLFIETRTGQPITEAVTRFLAA